MQSTQLEALQPLLHGSGFWVLPRVIFPGFGDIRGYKAMYLDFVRAVRDGRAPEMSLERAIEDHILMDRVYATVQASAERS